MITYLFRISSKKFKVIILLGCHKSCLRRRLDITKKAKEECNLIGICVPLNIPRIVGVTSLLRLVSMNQLDYVIKAL